MTAKKKLSSERYTVGRSLSQSSYSSKARKPSPARSTSSPIVTDVDDARPSDSTSTERKKRRQKKSKTARSPGQDRSDSNRRFWSRKKVALLIFMIIISPIIFIGVWDARNVSEASQKMFGSGNLLGAFAPATLSGSERGRVNVMVVGYSADNPGHAGANLTDSIMVLSMDTKDKTGYMLSIPRDMYVTIPDSGKAKINEAFQRGESTEFTEAGYANGGMGLLQKTITESFGIQIDYYALINYAAVRDITNSLGDIQVTIDSKDPRGIFDPNFLPQEGGPLTLSNGPHTIDGQTALKLTRARGATSGSYGFALSDFDRTKNQQLVFAGMKQGMTWQLLLDPRENKQVLNAVAENVTTDAQLNEVVPLFRLFNRIPQENLLSINLRDMNGRNLLQGYTTPTGQSALIPAAGANDFSEIQAAIQSFSQ